MKIQSVLLDIDGTLFTGMTPLPGAGDAVKELKKRGIPYRFLSNGTRRCRQTVLEKLMLLNIPVHEDEIITPAIAAIRYLKGRDERTCTLLSCGDLADDFTRAGITLSDDADVVVIGDAGENFSHANMNRLFRQISNGARLIALEKDRFWKDHDGPTLGAGPFITALEYATGTLSTLIGKPSPEYFRMAIESMQADPATTLMIGDDIATDIGGAASAGLLTALVFTGKSKQEHLVHAEKAPHILLPSIALLPNLFDERC